MTRTLYFKLTTCLLLALCVLLPAAEKKDKESTTKKKVGAGTDQIVKGKEKAEEEGKAEKPAADPLDVDNFRKRTDPAAVEIVTLHDEIDKAYTELRTAMNVASGDDKEARKAKTEIKTLEAQIKRQSRKLEAAVGKLALPLDRDYKATKSKYDQLQAKAKQSEEQKQEKKATGYYQQADRLNTQLDGGKRTLDAVRSFLYFESAEGLDLGGKDANDAKGGKGAKDANDAKGAKGAKDRG